MAHNSELIAEEFLKRARSAGADDADAIVAGGNSVELEVRNGKLEHVERSEGVEAGLRVFIGNRQACVSGSDFSSESIAIMAEQAVAMAQAAPEDPFSGLADVNQLAASTDSCSLDLSDPADPPDLENIRDIACRAEAAALAVHGVTQTESAGAGHGSTTVCVAATNGFLAHRHQTSMFINCTAISGSGLEMEVDYCLESRVYASDLPTAEDIGKIAGARAASRAGPTRPPTGAFPVLYDERVSSSLISHLLSAINGTAITRGASWLLDAQGQQVLPEKITLSENPHLPRHQSSKLFDAEGLPTAQRELVTNGILQGWILDLATARKLGLMSTGNASRGTNSPPSPSVTNICLPDGENSREELISAMNTGLIITSMIGSTINPTTGDYSRGASGFWVEQGEVKGAVSEFTVAGNLKHMLMSVIAANDSKPFRRFRVPSLLVEGLTVAGA